LEERRDEGVKGWSGGVVEVLVLRFKVLEGGILI
jgi:hypothetical protein